MPVRASTPPTVDIDAPLLAQVSGLGEGYWAWVHRSIRPKESLRIFRSGALEFTSHVAWWHVLVVWIPIIGALLGLAVAWRGIGWGRAVWLAFVGFFVWTFLEYALHRWIFHYRPHSALGRRVHFLAHGIHHLDPWDATRLVFPPLAAIVIATPVFLAIYGVCRVASPDAALGTSFAVMGGLLIGYVVYDMTHYYTHHAKPKGRWGKFLKAYHLGHHHKWPDRMYGVTSPLWDVLLRTGRPTSSSPGDSPRSGNSPRG